MRTTGKKHNRYRVRNLILKKILKKLVKDSIVANDFKNCTTIHIYVYVECMTKMYL